MRPALVDTCSGAVGSVFHPAGDPFLHAALVPAVCMDAWEPSFKVTVDAEFALACVLGSLSLDDLYSIIIMHLHRNAVRSVRCCRLATRRFGHLLFTNEGPSVVYDVSEGIIYLDRR